MAAWDTFTNQDQWEQYLKQLVKSNDRALCKAIVLIYQNQTDEEQMKGQSLDDNYVGFTKWDAEEMTSIAQKIIHKQQLTKREIAKSRNKMQKYWKQLMVISKKNIQRRELEQSQRELEEQRAEYELEQEILRQHNEILRQCAEDGIACGYGICDECVLTTGFQMKIGADDEEWNVAAQHERI